MIYADNGATSFPKPPSVGTAVQSALRDFGANPGRSGHFLSQRAAREVYGARAALAEFFNAAGAEKVAFTQNATYGLNLVIKGLLESGDHVVLSSLEHNAVLRPVAAMAKQGVSYSIAKVVLGDDCATLRAFEQAITPQTKAIVCTLASNVCGYGLPFEQIGELAKRKGILFVADGAQAAGYLPINVAEAGIDFLCIPGHKGLYGPMGVGAVIVNCDHPLRTLIEGGAGSFAKELAMPQDYPERLEGGTLNLPGIAGLRAGVRWVAAHPERLERERALGRLLYEQMGNIPGVLLQKNAPDARSAALFSFLLQGQSCGETEMLLSEHKICVRGGQHCAPLAHEALGTPEGSVRISLGMFNTRREMEIISRTIAKISEIHK